MWRGAQVAYGGQWTPATSNSFSQMALLQLRAFMDDYQESLSSSLQNATVDSVTPLGPANRRRLQQVRLPVRKQLLQLRTRSATHVRPSQQDAQPFVVSIRSQPCDPAVRGFNFVRGCGDCTDVVQTSWPWRRHGVKRLSCCPTYTSCMLGISRSGRERLCAAVDVCPASGASPVSWLMADVQGWDDRRGLLAGNDTLYSVLLNIGCNASAVQRVADDFQAVVTTGRLVVSHSCSWCILRCHQHQRASLHLVAACKGA